LRKKGDKSLSLRSLFLRRRFRWSFGGYVEESLKGELRYTQKSRLFFFSLLFTLDLS
jgi:hypothetical protein